MFENAQIQPDFVTDDDTGKPRIDLTIMLKEKPQRSFDADLEWQLAKPHAKVPVPLPVGFSPGGTMMYEDRNFLNRADILNSNVSSSSFLHPLEDFAARLTWRRPAAFVRKGPNNTPKEHVEFPEDLVFDAFNARRTSSAFAGGSAPNAQSNPQIANERVGLKLGIERVLTRHSLSSLNAVLQQVRTSDESGATVSRAQRLGPRNEVENGPPTTLSSSGVDRSLHLQFATLRDTTCLENGGVVGSRDVLEVDQGVGLGNGVFNRCGSVRLQTRVRHRCGEGGVVTGARVRADTSSVARASSGCGRRWSGPHCRQWCSCCTLRTATASARTPRTTGTFWAGRTALARTRSGSWGQRGAG